MPKRSTFLRASASTIAAAALPAGAAAQSAKANVLLVHGALSDGSVWRLVIPILQAAGHRVVAVQNPLTSASDDIANTQVQLAQLGGPTVVVGHSYGGFVITNAARDARNVKSLVYVTALAPDAGESSGDLIGKFPSAVSYDFVPSGPAGSIICNPAKFPDDFAADLTFVDAAVLAATQKPTAVNAFASKSGAPAWKQVPAFYAVSTNDRALLPGLQRFLASRTNATSIDVPASHFSMLSQPQAIARLILRAAS